MSAQEFDEATPREVQWRITAYYEGAKADMRRQAQLAAWVLSAFGGHVTVKRLMGEPEFDRF